MDGESYFVKDVPRHYPSSIRRVPVPKREGGAIQGLREPDALDQSRFLASLGMTILRLGHLEEPETKMDFGIIMWTPLLPSTSSVMWRSAATLASM